jgi:hypothetical protein
MKQADFKTKLPLGEKYVVTGLPGFTPMMNPMEAWELGVVKFNDTFDRRLEEPYFAKATHEEYWPKIEDWYLGEFIKVTKIHSQIVHMVWFGWYSDLYQYPKLRVPSAYNELMVEFYKRSLMAISEIPKEKLETPPRVKQMYLEFCWNFAYPLNFTKSWK